MPKMHMKIAKTELYEVEIDLTDQQIVDIENSKRPGEATKQYVDQGSLLETEYSLFEFDKIA